MALLVINYFTMTPEKKDPINEYEIKEQVEEVVEQVEETKEELKAEIDTLESEILPHL